jgi:biopolymer transport protein ExbB/TolQ
MQEPGPHIMLWVYFQQGGIAMYPLLLASILCVGIGIERIVTLYRAGRADRLLEPSLKEMLAAGQVAEAARRCERGDGPLARVMQAGLTANEDDPGQRQKAVERALIRETGQMERYMPVLATIGSVSPFVGLFGTVLGIMRAFRDIGLAGSAGSAVVAAGIAEALVATATGLFVAVLAVIAYNHLMTWAQSLITSTQLNVEELLSRIEE